MGWKKPLKKVLLEVGKLLLTLGLKWLFKTVDKNNDGVISKDEAWNFVVDKIRYLYKQK